jgi:hypothetical protein
MRLKRMGAWVRGKDLLRKATLPPARLIFCAIATSLCRYEQGHMWKCIEAQGMFRYGVMVVERSAERSAPILAVQWPCLFPVAIHWSVSSLQHKASAHRLHSHEVKYGSGSGQQSVTGFKGTEDINSFWVVRGPNGAHCRQGCVTNPSASR